MVKVSIEAEEVFEKTVKPYGNSGAFIGIPLRHKGKKAIICILRKVKAIE